MIMRVEIMFGELAEAQRAADTIDRAGWQTHVDVTPDGVGVVVHLVPGDDVAGLFSLISEVT